MKKNHRIKNLKNKRFGHLLVTKITHEKRWGNIVWECKCDCGNKIKADSHSLLRGNIISCGCFKASVCQSIGKNRLTHGMTNTRFYKIWANIKDRCTNPNNPAYFNYGGRGIAICKEWLEFENFKKDMYESYLKHVEEFGEKDTTGDRYPNNDGNYEFNNFRWATRIEQVLGRRCQPKSKDLQLHKFWRLKLGKVIYLIVREKCLTSKYLKYFGCTSKQLRKYIKSLFLPGMTWKNYGAYTRKTPNTWSVDHIVPCYKFDLSVEKDRYKCFNYKNLRPLWGKDNTSKIR